MTDHAVPKKNKLIFRMDDKLLLDDGSKCYFFKHVFDATQLIIVRLDQPFFSEDRKHYVTLLVVHESNVRRDTEGVRPEPPNDCSNRSC